LPTERQLGEKSETFYRSEVFSGGRRITRIDRLRCVRMAATTLTNFSKSWRFESSEWRLPQSLSRECSEIATFLHNGPSTATEGSGRARPAPGVCRSHTVSAVVRARRNPSANMTWPPAASGEKPAHPSRISRRGAIFGEMRVAVRGSGSGVNQGDWFKLGAKVH
jgi:hypothetical protein